MLVDSSQPRWFCRVCKFGCDTYPDFSQHLYGYDHEDRLAGCTCLPLDEFEIYHQYLDDLEKVSLEDLLQVLELDDPLPVAVSGPSEKDASRELPKPMLKAKNIYEVKKVKQSEKANRKQRLKAKKEELLLKKKLDQLSLIQMHFQDLQNLVAKKHEEEMEKEEEEEEEKLIC